MKSNNRGLLVLLCVLGVAIVGLTAGIILMGGKKTEEETEVSESQQSYEEYVAYVDEFDAVINKTQILLEQEPVDIQAIIKMYDECIKKRLDAGEYDRASAFMRAEFGALTSSGFKEEALDVFTKIDFTVFDEPEQYRWYDRIITIAKELSDDDVVKKYEPLLEKTRAANEASLEGTRWAAEELESLEVEYNQGDEK